jgi:hypothetical protein
VKRGSPYELIPLHRQFSSSRFGAHTGTDGAGYFHTNSDLFLGILAFDDCQNNGSKRLPALKVLLYKSFI